MNKVHITISVYKNDELYFFHHHSFSNLDIEFKSDKVLVLCYLKKVDELINPKDSFLSVLEVLTSTAFCDGTSFIEFKNYKKDLFKVKVEVLIC